MKINLTSFFHDMGSLLWWSFFQPSRLRAYMQALHVELTPRTGLSQQLWLARRSPGMRRFLAMQLALWVSAGLLGDILWILTAAIINPEFLTAENIAFGAAFGVAGGVALGMSGGVAVGVSGVVAFGVAVGMAGVVAGVVAGEVAGGLAGGLALVVAVGVAGPVFDQLRQRSTGLSDRSYWGRSLAGVAFGVVVVAAIGVAGELGDGALVVAGGVAVVAAGVLEMFIEERRLTGNWLKWTIIDGLLLVLAVGEALRLAGGVFLGIVIGGGLGQLCGRAMGYRPSGPWGV